MNKSIETMWKEGFVDDMALIAPKINDLYNQKSKNLIDKFEHMFAVNQKGVLIAAFVIFAILAVFGVPVLGLIIALMLSGLVAVGKKQLRELKTINKDVSSFDYLKAFDQWLDKSIQDYVKVYRFFYPSLFLVCAIWFLFSDIGAELINSIPEMYSVFDIPIIILAGLVVVTLLIGLVAERVYRADVKLYYGGEMTKLKELISDMENLKA